MSFITQIPCSKSDDRIQQTGLYFWDIIKKTTVACQRNRFNTKKLHILYIKKKKKKQLLRNVFMHFICQMDYFYGAFMSFLKLESTDVE